MISAVGPCSKHFELTPIPSTSGLPDPHKALQTSLSHSEAIVRFPFVRFLIVAMYAARLVLLSSESQLIVV